MNQIDQPGDTRTASAPASLIPRDDRLQRRTFILVGILLGLQAFLVFIHWPSTHAAILIDATFDTGLALLFALVRPLPLRNRLLTLLLVPVPIT